MIDSFKLILYEANSSLPVEIFFNCDNKSYHLIWVGLGLVIQRILRFFIRITDSAANKSVLCANVLHKFCHILIIPLYGNNDIMMNWEKSQNVTWKR